MTNQKLSKSSNRSLYQALYAITRSTNRKVYTCMPFHPFANRIILRNVWPIDFSELRMCYGKDKSTPIRNETWIHLCVESSLKGKATLKGNIWTVRGINILSLVYNIGKSYLPQPAMAGIMVLLAGLQQFPKSALRQWTIWNHKLIVEKTVAICFRDKYLISCKLYKGP